MQILRQARHFLRIIFCICSVMSGLESVTGRGSATQQLHKMQRRQMRMKWSQRWAQNTQGIFSVHMWMLSVTGWPFSNKLESMFGDIWKTNCKRQPDFTSNSHKLGAIYAAINIPKISWTSSHKTAPKSQSFFPVCNLSSHLYQCVDNDINDTELPLMLKLKKQILKMHAEGCHFLVFVLPPLSKQTMDLEIKLVHCAANMSYL